jgi:hypothetical protein
VSLPGPSGIAEKVMSALLLEDHGWGRERLDTADALA